MSFLQSAALQLLASRVLFARGDFKAASTLANDSRTSVAAAHEYAAKRAEARKRPGARGELPPWFVRDDEEASK